MSPFDLHLTVSVKWALSPDEPGGGQNGTEHPEGFVNVTSVDAMAANVVLAKCYFDLSSNDVDDSPPRT